MYEIMVFFVMQFSEKDSVLFLDCSAGQGNECALWASSSDICGRKSYCWNCSKGEICLSDDSYDKFLRNLSVKSRILKKTKS